MLKKFLDWLDAGGVLRSSFVAGLVCGGLIFAIAKAFRWYGGYLITMGG